MQKGEPHKIFWNAIIMNILVLRVSAIGDVIHTLPAIFFLKKACPKAQISWVVQSKVASILHGQPFLDKVYLLPDKFLFPRNWRKLILTINEIRKKKWDVILDLQGIAKTSILLPFLKGEKYGFDSQNSRLPLSSLFTNKHIVPSYANIIQKNLALICGMLKSRLGEKFVTSPSFESIKNSFKLNFGQNNKLIVAEWLKDNRIEKFFILSPNTTWNSKVWPTESWKKLLLLLKDKLPDDYSVLLAGKDFGIQAEQLATFCEIRKLPVFIIPKWDLLKVSYLISLSNLLVAPDTGLLHMADFLSKKTIGIFGPTLAKKHGPFVFNQNINNVIQVDCPHRYQKTHGKNNESCMYKLLPEDLLNKILKVLEED